MVVHCYNDEDLPKRLKSQRKKIEGMLQGLGLDQKGKESMRECFAFLMLGENSLSPRHSLTLSRVTKSSQRGSVVLGVQ